MTAKDLKNALLQEAVQGKLVPQIASEGNARDLLEEIRKSHTDLQIPTESAGNKKGDLRSKSQIRVTKKEKNLPEITDDEVPFDIPESWCWCRLGDIISIETNLVDSSKYLDYIQIAPDDIGKGTGTLITERKTVRQKEIKSINHLFHADMILYSKIRPRLQKVVYVDFEGLCSADMYPLQTKINKLYLKYVLLSEFFDKEIKDFENRVKMPKLNKEQLNSTKFPLPPLAEQKRIVAAIEKFMPLIEEYGKKETVLNQLNAQIGTLTKKAILQEAVQGKLVPQIASEGNARDLLEQIKAQKATLIKEGKIKKDKPLPEITENEIPFDIPENWCYITPIDVGYFMAGQTPKPSELLKAGDIPYFKVSDMNNEGNELYMNTVINYLNPNTKYKLIPAKSIIYPKNGGAVFTNKKRILKKDSLVDLNTGAYVPFEGIDFDYLFLLFSNIDFKQYYKGTALPTVDTDAVKKIIWGLPPLAEQKRIVAAIEQLLPLCEKLGK